MPKPRYPTKVLVGLTPQMKQELCAEAERRGDTMSGLIRQLVAAYLLKRKGGEPA